MSKNDKNDLSRISPQTPVDLLKSHRSLKFVLGIRKSKSKRNVMSSSDIESQLTINNANFSDYGTLNTINHDLSSVNEDLIKKTNVVFDVKSDIIGFKNLILSNWINLLLFFVPFGIVAQILRWNSSAIFFLNFLGMIPLAAILGDATEILAEHLGEIVGGLLNATFGNAVEVVVMIFTLLRAKEFGDNLKGKQDMLIVVQTSLIGSVFSNSLLVLGCSFLANGIFHKLSQYSVKAASANVSLLMIAAFVMLLPGPYSHSNPHYELLLSRIAAIVLLFMYCCLMYFVLITHKDILNDDTRNRSNLKSVSIITSSSFYKNDNDIDRDSDNDDDVELSMLSSILLLFISTTLVSIMSEFLVDSIEPMTIKLGMNTPFVGIILLPIIGNAVEHITAVRMAIKGKMDIALSIAIGSATQVGMFVVGLAVIIGWIMDLPLSLSYDPFEVKLFIFSSIIIFGLIFDGTSHWLQGIMLLCLYVLVAASVYNQEYKYTPVLYKYTAQ